MLEQLEWWRRENGDVHAPLEVLNELLTEPLNKEHLLNQQALKGNCLQAIALGSTLVVVHAAGQIGEPPRPPFGMALLSGSLNVPIHKRFTSFKTICS